MDTFVFNRERDLSPKMQVPQCQFVTQTGMVGGFQQAGPKFPMYLNGRGNYFTCESTMQEMRLLTPFRAMASGNAQFHASIEASMDVILVSNLRAFRDLRGLSL